MSQRKHSSRPKQIHKHISQSVQAKLLINIYDIATQHFSKEFTLTCLTNIYLPELDRIAYLSKRTSCSIFWISSCLFRSCSIKDNSVTMATSRLCVFRGEVGLETIFLGLLGDVRPDIKKESTKQGIERSSLV